ncbi:unnamed protein product, partial [Prorocentrum cordatum]
MIDSPQVSYTHTDSNEESQNEARGSGSLGTTRPAQMKLLTPASAHGRVSCRQAAPQSNFWSVMLTLWPDGDSFQLHLSSGPRLRRGGRARHTRPSWATACIASACRPNWTCASWKDRRSSPHPASLAHMYPGLHRAPLPALVGEEVGRDRHAALALPQRPLQPPLGSLARAHRGLQRGRRGRHGNGGLGAPPRAPPPPGPNTASAAPWQAESRRPPRVRPSSPTSRGRPATPRPPGPRARRPAKQHRRGATGAIGRGPRCRSGAMADRGASEGEEEEGEEEEEEEEDLAAGAATGRGTDPTGPLRRGPAEPEAA